MILDIDQVNSVTQGHVMTIKVQSERSNMKQLRCHVRQVKVHLHLKPDTSYSNKNSKLRTDRVFLCVSAPVTRELTTGRKHRIQLKYSSGKATSITVANSNVKNMKHRHKTWPHVISP